MRRASLVILPLCALLSSAPGCAQRDEIRRFPLRAPLWNDPDRYPVPRPPEPIYSGLYADAVDKTLFWPPARWLTFRRGRESVNVNAYDEVPDSSWFTNRIGLRKLTLDEVLEGPCDAPPPDERGTWLVTSAKRGGKTPGLVVRGPDGVDYVFKLEEKGLPQRGAAADAIASRIYHAAGYFAPCNNVVHLRREQLVLAPGATTTDQRGKERPLTAPRLAELLERTELLPDGRLRASISRILPGRPLGPHRLHGVRKDDPNDVVPHEDRRELRGMHVLAAWLGHFDAREQNSLDVWIEEGGRGFVRHYQLDFGDAFGSTYRRDRLNRRVNRSYYLDPGQITADLLTLGLIPRPWYRDDEPSAIFGYYDIQTFDPPKWRPIYPNPAFKRMTWRDALWMTRIIVRFSDEQLRALAKVGRFTASGAERYLADTLIGRRDRIARYYLTRYVPLARPAVVPRGPTGQSLCFEDLAIAHAGVDPAQVRYDVFALGGPRLDQVLARRVLRPGASRPALSCVPLPPQHRRPSAWLPANTPPGDARRYVVVQIAVRQGPGRPPTSLEAHLYDLGPGRGLVLAGIERHERPRLGDGA